MLDEEQVAMCRAEAAVAVQAALDASAASAASFGDRLGIVEIGIVATVTH